MTDLTYCCLPAYIPLSHSCIGFLRIPALRVRPCEAQTMNKETPHQGLRISPHPTMAGRTRSQKFRISLDQETKSSKSAMTSRPEGTMPTKKATFFAHSSYLRQSLYMIALSSSQAGRYILHILSLPMCPLFRCPSIECYLCFLFFPIKINGPFNQIPS